MAVQSMGSVALTCNTDVRFIELIQIVESELLKYTSFSQEEGERIWTAVQEGVNNGMRHGNQLDPKRQLAVTFTPQADQLEVRIEDEGAGVDLKTVPVPSPSPHVLKPKGSGVQLMRDTMDSVTMHQEKGRNTLVLIKKRK